MGSDKAQDVQPPRMSHSFVLMGVGALVLILGVFSVSAIVVSRGTNSRFFPKNPIYAKMINQSIPLVCIISFGGILCFIFGGVMFAYEKKQKEKEEHQEIQIVRTKGNAESLVDSKKPEEIKLLTSKAYKGATITIPNVSGSGAPTPTSPMEKLAEDPWWISWEHMSLESQILGKGNFGQVQKGTVFDKKTGQTQVAAIKTMRTTKGNKNAEEAYELMVAEMEIMKKIGYHPNIVNLLGYCEHDGSLFVAIEFAPYGDLKTFLKKAKQTKQDMEKKGEKGDPLSVTQMLKFALDVAKGMEHLAKHGIIHRDLAARNILLAEGSYGLTTVAKVADFGLARDMSAVYGIYVKESKTGELPIRWTAPEAIFDHVFTEKSDVWAFGIMLWEIVTLGQNPYPEIQQNADFYNRLKLGYRMDKPPNCDDDIFQVMRWCWKTAPSERPTFALLKKHLDKMLTLRHAQKYISEEGSLKNV